MAKRIESHSAEDPDWSGDPGVRSIANLYNEAFCVDKEWSFKKARAFEWWAHDLRQVLWADVGFRDQGIDIFRLCARTDFLDDVKISGKQLNDALNEINARTSHSSAAVFDPQDCSIRLWTICYVHERTESWLRLHCIAEASCQEKVSDHTGKLLKFPQSTKRKLFELVRPGHYLLPHRVMLDVGPHGFIGIQLR